MDINNRDYVNSLARGLDVIRAFTRARPNMTLSEISAETSMTRATVRRFLLTLVREGYVETDGKNFTLRPKVLELGYAALSSMTFLDVVQPIMSGLAEKLKESCSLAVLDGADVVYVACASPPDRIVGISVSVGSRVPAHVVSTGRVLIAALSKDQQRKYLVSAKLTRLTPNTVTSTEELRTRIEETARQGWSIVDQELEVGLRSIAVPLREQSGAVVAALNVACPTSRISPEEMRDTILVELQAAAKAITDAL